MAPQDRQEVSRVPQWRLISNTLCRQVDTAEAEGLYTTALAAKRSHARPLDLFDLMFALKKDKAVIPSHSVYSINMERIQMKLHHKT